jgi:putative hemolysin
LAIVVFVGLAGLFSGAETGIYQLSRVRLRLGVEKKQLSFVILGKAMRDSPALLLSMLVGTNLAQYLATSAVTLALLSYVKVARTTELFATLITAPTLFVFSELIPKSIFFYRADSLMPFFAPVLFSFHKLLTWCRVVPVLRGFSQVFGRLTGSPISSGAVISDVRSSHIKAIFHETREEAFLSPVQTDIINRVVTIPNIRITSVMTPINKVQTVDADSDKATVLDILRRCAFTRLPVYERHATNIIGFIHIYDCLGSAEEFTDLHDFLQPLRRLAGEVTVSEAINIMQRENQKMILVTRPGHAGRERAVGIVTMKDLVEELLGELAEW